MASDFGSDVVIVACGSRDLPWPLGWVHKALLKASGGGRVRGLFHGGARGADRMAAKCARRMGWPVIELMAEWSKHGAAAGPIRNRRMIAEAGELARGQGCRLVVLAFPGGNGTASCCFEARRWHQLSDGEVGLEIRVQSVKGPVSEFR
ncbi:MAG: SLOG family protein [Prochlorococcaceae cyanobacterium]